MKRKSFLSIAGILAGGVFMNHTLITTHNVKPEELLFKDDGKIPNSKLRCFYTVRHLMKKETGGQNGWRTPSG
jgi:hypothetical protein